MPGLKLSINQLGMLYPHPIKSAKEGPSGEKVYEFTKRPVKPLNELGVPRDVVRSLETSAKVLVNPREGEMWQALANHIGVEIVPESEIAEAAE